MMKANKLRLGIFFVTAMFFLLAVIVWLTGGLGGRKASIYACYFDWSVSGLNVGGDVMYNGVLVGQIREISLAPDGRLVQVLMDMDPGFTVDSEITASLVATGITGGQDIDLHRAQPGEVRHNAAADLSFEPPVPVIPVAQGMMQKLSHMADRLVEVVDVLDMDVLMELLGNMNRLLDDAEVDVLVESLVSNSRNLDTLLITYTRLGRNADLLITDIRRELPGLSSDADSLMERLGRLAETLDAFALNTGAALEPVSRFAGQAGELVPLIREGLDGMVTPPRREVSW
jgi:phospholipid/cholesterol/gamma-HCH transport system substrate-binding protein